MITVHGRGIRYLPNLPDSVSFERRSGRPAGGPFMLATCGNVSLGTFLATGPEGLYFLVQTPVMRKMGYVISLPAEDLMSLPSAADMRPALSMTVSNDGIRVDATGHHDKRFRLYVRFRLLPDPQSFKVTRRSYGRWLSQIQDAAGLMMASLILDA